jgi:hypothetical protein
MGVTRLLTLPLAAAILALGAPAHAGNGFWSSEPCNPDVEWYGTSYGVWYWLWGYSESHGAHLVPFGFYMDRYASQGWQCGTLRAPLTNVVCVTRNYAYQDFQGGRISSNFCP